MFVASGRGIMVKCCDERKPKFRAFMVLKKKIGILKGKFQKKRYSFKLARRFMKFSPFQGEFKKIKL